LTIEKNCSICVNMIGLPGVIIEKSDFPIIKAVKKMKDILPSRSILRRISVPILLIAFIQLAFVTTLNAQGWTFTIQLSVSGPCGGYTPYIPPYTVPMGIPTLSECNSMRQDVLNISASVPMYDEHGNYIGECRAFFICSECMGSDIGGSTSSFAAGNVSVNGLTQGTAFFAPHESSELERWLEDYLQRMNLLAKNGTAPTTMSLKDIPLTKDNEFNKYYIDQTLRFEKPEQGGVVDLSGTKSIFDTKASSKGAEPKAGSEATKPATVPLFRDQAEENIKEQFRKGFSPVDPVNGMYRVEIGNLEAAPFWTSDEMIELGKAAIGIPIMLIEGAASNVVIPVVNLAFEDLKAGVQLVRSISDSTVTVPTTGQILVNTVKSSAGDFVLKGIDEFAIGKMIGKTFGSEAMELYGKSPGIAGSASTAWGISQAGKN
jgi:hypothetical protein